MFCNRYRSSGADSSTSIEVRYGEKTAGLSLPAGSRLTLTLQGKDFERPGETGPMRGVAWFTHDDPTDRPPERFDGINTLYTGGARESYLLMPVVS